jgi:hypothetical protein
MDKEISFLFEIQNKPSDKPDFNESVLSQIENGVIKILDASELESQAWD